MTQPDDRARTDATGAPTPLPPTTPPPTGFPPPGGSTTPPGGSIPLPGGSIPLPGGSIPLPPAAPPGGTVLGLSRRTAVRVGIAVGACLVLGLLAVVHSVIGRMVFSPDKPVLAYVRALEEGRASDALALAEVDVPTDARGLLTDEVYADVPDRPTDGRVTEVSRRGGNATVVVESRQDGATVTSFYDVRTTGRQLLLWDRWELAAQEVPTTSVYSVLPRAADPFVVNGVEHAAGDGEFRAFPGTYTVSLAIPDGAEGLIESETVDVTVSADAFSVYLGVSDSIEHRLTDQAHGVVVAATEDHLATACFASTSLDVPDCAITTWEYRADEATGVTWAGVGSPTITPTVEKGRLVAEVSGDARLTYDLPERGFRAASSVDDVVAYAFSIRFETEDGALVRPEVDRHGFWD